MLEYLLLYYCSVLSPYYDYMFMFTKTSKMNERGQHIPAVLLLTVPLHRRAQMLVTFELMREADIFVGGSLASHFTHMVYAWLCANKRHCPTLGLLFGEQKEKCASGLHGIAQCRSIEGKP